MKNKVITVPSYTSSLDRRGPLLVYNSFGENDPGPDLPLQTGVKINAEKVESIAVQGNDSCHIYQRECGQFAQRA